MVAADVIGNDVAISIGGQSGISIKRNVVSRSKNLSKASTF